MDNRLELIEYIIVPDYTSCFFSNYIYPCVRINLVHVVSVSY